jgi:serine/threonine-protein kinase HipA
VTSIPLDELTGVDRADVYKAGRLAGSLQRRDDGVIFTYSEEYVAIGGPSIATTLPTSESEHRTSRAGAVPPFFAGLLPEGRRLSGLRRAVKTSLDDELSLLLAIGNDAVGDVQVVPHGIEPADVAPLVTVQRQWSEVRFADLLADSSTIDPVGIAGVQDKASARMISVPVARAGQRFILKIDPPEYPHVVINEAFFLTAARAAGLTCCDAEVVHDADGRPGLLVHRFDRVPTADGRTIALACEDACQVLGVWPEAKYRLTAAEIVTGLSNACPAQLVARRNVFEQLVFAWLCGNGDTHAKNLSILAGLDGEWTISPAYDLVSTVIYGDRAFAVSVEGKRSGLSRQRFLSFAATIGLPERAATTALDGLVERTAHLATSVKSHDWPYDQSSVSRWVKELKFRHRQLARLTYSASGHRSSLLC